MSFTVPSFPHLKFRGLNICVVYTRAVDFDQVEWSCECMKISNKTKGLKWAYCPIYKGMAYEDKDVTWLSDWNMIVNQLMEGGDEVNVSVNMAQLFQVKEFGIRILYDDQEEEEGTQNNTSYTCHQNVIDLSVYRMKESEYMLNNSDSIKRAMDYKRISGAKWDCPEITGGSSLTIS